MSSMRQPLQGKNINKSLNTSYLGFKAPGSQDIRRSSRPHDEPTSQNFSTWRYRDSQARRLSFKPPSVIIENDDSEKSLSAKPEEGWKVAVRRQSFRGNRPANDFTSGNVRKNSMSVASRGGLRRPSVGSHYKQSALPVCERDPKLAEIEQNAGACLNRSSFKVGLIFRTVVHEALMDKHIEKGAKGRTESDYGPISTKFRKMIVISLHEDHCICLPIYTHNGEGCENKTKRDEFVSIRDTRSNVSAEDFQAETKHDPMITGDMIAGTEIYSSKAVIHITYPICHRYSSRLILEGELHRLYTPKLKRLFGQYLGFGT